MNKGGSPTFPPDLVNFSPQVAEIMLLIFTDPVQSCAVHGGDQMICILVAICLLCLFLIHCIETCAVFCVNAGHGVELGARQRRYCGVW